MIKTVTFLFLALWLLAGASASNAAPFYDDCNFNKDLNHFGIAELDFTSATLNTATKFQPAYLFDPDGPCKTMIPTACVSDKSIRLKKNSQILIAFERQDAACIIAFFDSGFASGWVVTSAINKRAAPYDLPTWIGKWTRQGPKATTLPASIYVVSLKDFIASYKKYKTGETQNDEAYGDLVYDPTQRANITSQTVGLIGDAGFIWTNAAREPTANLGGFIGMSDVKGPVLIFSADREANRSPTPESCIVVTLMLSDRLVVEDQGFCGGNHVSFSGSYKKSR